MEHLPSIVYLYESTIYIYNVKSAMNRRLTYWGIGGIVLSILLPVMFYLFTLISWDFVEGLFQGIDWFCCFSFSIVFFIAGLGTLIIGLRTE